MKKTIYYFISAILFLLEVKAFNIGTNIFEFTYEDKSIPMQKINLLSTDFENIITRNKNIDIVYTSSPTNGIFVQNNLHLYPYLMENVIPRKFVKYNGTNYITISKSTSDKLLPRLDIHNTYTNAYSSCTNFVTFLNSNMVNTLNSNEIKNVFYFHNTTEDKYKAYRDEFLNDLSSISFYNPPLSSFFIKRIEINQTTQNFIWTCIPCHDSENTLQFYVAVFFNNYWHLLSPDDPIITELEE